MKKALILLALVSYSALNAAALSYLFDNFSKIYQHQPENTSLSKKRAQLLQQHNQIYTMDPSSYLQALQKWAESNRKIRNPWAILVEIMTMTKGHQYDCTPTPPLAQEIERRVFVDIGDLNAAASNSTAREYNTLYHFNSGQVYDISSDGSLRLLPAEESALIITALRATTNTVISDQTSTSQEPTLFLTPYMKELERNIGQLGAKEELTAQETVTLQRLHAEFSTLLNSNHSQPRLHPEPPSCLPSAPTQPTTQGLAKPNALERIFDNVRLEQQLACFHERLSTITKQSSALNISGKEELFRLNRQTSQYLETVIAKLNTAQVSEYVKEIEQLIEKMETLVKQALKSTSKPSTRPAEVDNSTTPLVSIESITRTLQEEGVEASLENIVTTGKQTIDRTHSASNSAHGTSNQQPFFVLNYTSEMMRLQKK